MPKNIYDAKKIIFPSLLCFLFCGVYYFISSSKNQDVEASLTYEEALLIQDHHEKKIKNNKNEPLVSVENKKYTRLYPKYKLTDKEIDLFFSSYTSIEKLQKSIFEVKKTASLAKSKKDFSFHTLKEVNINLPPKNNKDFHNLIQEATIVAISNISKHIDKNSAENLQFEIGKIKALKFLSAFNFSGLNEKSQPVLELKESFYSSVKTNKSKDEKIFKVKQKKSQRLVSSEEESFEKNALKLLKESNPIAFSSYENKKNVDPFYKKEEASRSPVNKFFKAVLRFTVSSLSNIIPTLSEPTTIKDTADEIFKDILKYPNYHEKIPSPKYHVDLPFGVYARQITINQSISAALWTGGLTVALSASEAVLNFTKVLVVTLKVIGAAAEYIPLAAVVSGTNSYSGAKTLYQMHAYHSELSKDKENMVRLGTFKSNYAIVVEEKAINAAKRVESQHMSAAMEIEILKSWALAFFTGVGVDLYKKRGRFKNFSLRALNLERKVGALSLVSNKTRSKLARAWTSLSFAELLGGGKNFFKKGSLMSSVLNSPVFNQVKDLLIKGVGGLAGKIASTLLESATSYTIVFTRLELFTDYLQRIHTSPEMSIALVQLDSESDQFRIATESYFYPVCSYFAYNIIGNQQHRYASVSEFKDLPDSFIKLVSSRINSCLKLVGLMSNLKNKSSNIQGSNLEYLASIQNNNVNLTKGRLLKAYDISNIKDPNKFIPFNKKQINIFISYMSLMPDYYKVVWLGALRSIYPHKQIPDQFYDLRNLIVYDNEKVDPNIFWSFINSTKANSASATRHNISQFNYLLDYFSYQMCKGRKVRGTEEKKCDYTGILNSTDSFMVLWRNIPEVTVKDERIRSASIESNEKKPWYTFFVATIDAIYDSLNSFYWIFKKSIFGSPLDSDDQEQIKELTKKILESRKRLSSEQK